MKPVLTNRQKAREYLRRLDRLLEIADQELEEAEDKFARHDGGPAEDVLRVALERERANAKAENAREHHRLAHNWLD